MHIRLAHAEDLVSIMDLYHEAADNMEGTAHDCLWRRGGHPTPEFVGDLVKDNGMLIATEGDEIIGAVGIDHDLGHDYGQLPWLAQVEDELVAAIHLLVIRMSRRGQGLSRQLLRACLAEARERGMRTARLDATGNNAPAIALYESEGFSIVGANKIDVGIEGLDPVPFVVMERLL